MEDLLSLNDSNKRDESKTVKFDNLKVGEYFVKSFSLKENQYGLQVYVEIADFFIILPKRFSDKINSSEQIDELNLKKFKMTYHGKNVKEGNRVMLDFKPLGERELLDESELDSDVEAVAGSSKRKGSFETNSKAVSKRPRK